MIAHKIDWLLTYEMAMARALPKLMPYLGQQVEVTGTEVTLSNNYDARSFDLQTIKRKGK